LEKAGRWRRDHGSHSEANDNTNSKQASGNTAPVRRAQAREARFGAGDSKASAQDRR
jgi:hypothetical protein